MKAGNAYIKIIENISFWENSLANYSEEDFKRKPSEDSWSIGQVYVHLIYGTLRFQIKEIEKCMANNDNEHGKKTMPAKITFLIKSFPPIKIKVPPSKEYTPPQPENKDGVIKNIAVLKGKIKELAEAIDKSQNKGKTKHPAFGYLNAVEWYALVGMHFKHHKAQKKRIDAFLKG